MNRQIQILIFLIILLVGDFRTGICQEHDIKFDRFVVEDGLTSINSIIRDQNGFMWFGGTHGLYRYDGYEFKIFTHNQADSASLCGNNVISVYADNEGYLWIGTVNSGICIYDPKKESFSILKELENSTITCIHRDHQGVLWVGTIGEGLYTFDKTNNFITQFQNNTSDKTSISNNELFDIYEDNIGRIWVTTNSGSIDLFDRETNSFSRFYYNNNGYKSVRKGQKIFRDHQGYFWIGTEGDGLYRFDEKDKSFKHYTENSKKGNSISNNSITGMAEGAPGEIWITTDGGGLNLLNTRTLEFHHYKHNPLDENSLTNNSSYSLFIDKNLTMWLGMGDGVVNVSKKSPFKIYQPSTSGKNSLSFRVVVTLCLASNNKLWIGTGGGGIDVFDLKTRNFKNYRNNPDNSNSISTNIILALSEDSKNNIWSGTYLGGADRINFATNKITNFRNDVTNPNSLINDHIFDIEEDNSGVVWFATMGAGLGYYNPKRNEFGHYQHDAQNPESLISDRTRCLFEDSKSNLWIGTDDGAQIFDSANKKFINRIGNINLVELLRNNPVHDINEDSEGNIWFATDANGLCKLNPKTEEWKAFVIEDGMPSNSVYGVFEDKNKHIWSCTNKGISRYNPKTENFFVLNRDDGLPTNDFEAGSIVQTDEGELFFSSKKGLVSFFSEDIKQNLEEVEVTLTGFRIFNEPVSAGQIIDDVVPLQNSISQTDEILLPHYLNNISFEFAAPGFQNPAKIKYKYQMEGVENRWIEADSKQRISTYSDLNQGSYLFKVVAANSAGVWSTKETQIKVTITPPFWRTIWAYLLYIVTLTTIIFFIFREYSKRIRLNNQLEIERYKHEKDNELNLLKIGFFTNISHELRTPLTLILGPLERLTNSFKTDNRVRHQLMTMQRNGQRLLHIVNQLLDFRKVESGKMQLQIKEADIVAFIKEIVLSFQELAIQKQISFEVECEAELMSACFDKSKLEIMIFNLLSNAFKFTPENGEISLKVNYAGEYDKFSHVQIEVFDSGKGIHPDKLANIFDLFYQDNGNLDIKGTGIGLALTKNLTELHHGTIHAESETGKGSRFYIKIPALSESYKDHELVSYSEGNHQADKILKPILKTKEKVTGLEELPLMLVVEDNVDLNNFIGECFQQKYKIEKAFNGKEGFDMAIQHIPDIIISDVMMPEMDGVELCKKLKQDFRTSHIPVILLTARSAEIYQLEGLENGADDYITKPFSFELLEVRVANLIEIRRQLQERFKRESIIKPKELAITNPDEKFLEKLMKILDEHISNSELSVEYIAVEIGMSHSALYRKLQALSGKNINDFIRTYRLQRAAQLLKKSEYSINEISDITGFSNPKYFSTCFKKEYGVTPSEFRKD